ncbi:MAG: class I SAM-dependent methyltransferase [Gammaproteobacteria bacterium]|nr:class I SAM-dependent methyltransferase [Gammaproteobacteria bacterium]NIR83911.1 class I SAM-dependent methyltransferase [Gammaproteobacteria bacterium]NIU05203.1 class I SAM-dependent methyltransferase [Gammaproteobacteria bacterium]NIV52059.1 class I SAM-dependent methyltransferase [Gammaproteobacteria bacterium]NIX86476.1 class I SAM-dependent methyltransferase [Gammaproteobacteria bacterium]
MSELSVQELEDVAAAYDELLAPALFQEWTSRVADAAALRAGQRVLDVACGTGVLARAAAARVGPGGSVAGLDINPGMLSVAARIAPEVEWRHGSAESLPYEDESFDAVVSQFGLMFFSDRRAALREMARVLAHGGRLAVAVFDSLDNIPVYATMANVLQRLVGRGVAGALRFPFSLGDREELSSLSAAAGITSARVDTQKGAARFPSVRAMVLADVKGWFPLAGIHLERRTIEAVVAEAEAALERFLASDGTVELEVSVHIVTATKA